MKLNKFIFPAPTSSYDYDSMPGELIWIPRIGINDKPAIPCLYLECSRGSSKTLLYFHGNAEDIGAAYDLLDHLRSTLLMHVIAIEYPGYGIYTGKPSASRVIDDANNVFQYLVTELSISSRDIIVFGRSIGTGPAC